MHSILKLCKLLDFSPGAASTFVGHYDLVDVRLAQSDLAVAKVRTSASYILINVNDAIQLADSQFEDVQSLVVAEVPVRGDRCLLCRREMDESCLLVRL